MEQLKLFASLFRSSIKDLLPIIAVIIFFQAVIFQQVPENLISLSTGLLIVALGLTLFLQGLEIGIFPLGENLANEFASKGSLFWLLLFAFLIGFSTTIAEPALIAIANEAAEISGGKIDAVILRIVVALSVGSAITIGALRIVLGIPIHLIIIFGYIAVIAITYFTPENIVGLAYDSGGVTTSTVTVPLVAALGIGLASSIRGRDPVVDGFGLIALASLTPMFFVQVYGIFVYHILPSANEAALAAEAVKEIAKIPTDKQTFGFLEAIGSNFLGVVRDVAPIVLVIAFFQYLIIKKKIPGLKRVLTGLLLLIVGLDAFVVGLEMGLFELGESMADQLTNHNNLFIIYLFGFLIGFSTTMAEPALIAVALKAKEVSGGKINDFYLRIFVAIGVAIGIALGCYRIVSGDSIQYYIMIGYVAVVILTYFAPKYIVPIAYDSGGVTTSTVTVPLVAALGLGLAANIEGRNPLIDGFGLIAFASLFPMITVMIYGVLGEIRFKGDRQ